MSDNEETVRQLLAAAAPQTDPVDFEIVAQRARRRRLRQLTTVGSLAVLVAGAGITTVAVAGDDSSAQITTYRGHKVVRGGNVGSTIRLAGSYEETFAPPPPYLHAKLSAQEAYDAFNRRHRPIPPDVSYQLGIVTVPPSVTDVLVWGFSSQPGACLRTGGSLRLPGQSPRPTPSAPPQRCIEWEFISATTGRFVIGTAQLVDGSPPSAPPPSRAEISMDRGGFLDAGIERYSPERLVLQGPQSVIRWTFDNTDCSIELHWFLPPETQRSTAHPSCVWPHRFVKSLTTTFVSRGRVFTVVAGYVQARQHYYVTAVLANGESQVYDAADADGAWMFVVQRCGNIEGTAIRSVSEGRYKRGIVKTIVLPPEASPDPAIAARCESK